MRQAEIEVKVDRRPDFLHLSLGLSFNLPITLADFLSIMLKQVHGLAIQAQEADRPGAAKIADVLKWQDEAGYPPLCLCTAKRAQGTGSNSDDLSGGSRSRRTPRLWREIERCAECAA